METQAFVVNDSARNNNKNNEGSITASPPKSAHDHGYHASVVVIVIVHIQPLLMLRSGNFSSTVNEHSTTSRHIRHSFHNAQIHHRTTLTLLPYLILSTLAAIFIQNEINSLPKMTGNIFFLFFLILFVAIIFINVVVDHY